MAAEGMQFPWRWASGTISTNLDVIWGMSVQETRDQLPVLQGGGLSGPCDAGAFAVGPEEGSTHKNRFINHIYLPILLSITSLVLNFYSDIKVKDDIWLILEVKILGVRGWLTNADLGRYEHHLASQKACAGPGCHPNRRIGQP